MLFSLFVATLITWSGAVVGAQISFEISRKYGRPPAGRWLSERSLERADRLVRSAIGIVPGAILFTTSGTGLAALYRIQPALAGTTAPLGFMDMDLMQTGTLRVPLRISEVSLPLSTLEYRSYV